jgi:signal recognition particle GTPase
VVEVSRLIKSFERMQVMMRGLSARGGKRRMAEDLLRRAPAGSPLPRR